MMYISCKKTKDVVYVGVCEKCNDSSLCGTYQQHVLRKTIKIKYRWFVFQIIAFGSIVIIPTLIVGEYRSDVFVPSGITAFVLFWVSEFIRRMWRRS